MIHTKKGAVKNSKNFQEILNKISKPFSINCQSFGTIFPKGKKGFEFSSRKFIQLMILLVVFFFLVTYSSELFGKTHDGVSGEKGIISVATEEICETTNGRSFEIINCDPTNFNYICTKEEQDKFNKYIKYLGDKSCPGSGEVGVEKDKACTCVQQKTYDIIMRNNQIQEEKFNSESYVSNKLSDSSINEINTPYLGNTENLEKFAKQNNIDINVLNAILLKESNNRNFYSDGHPIVRFECHIFNGRSKHCKEFFTGNENVPCTIDPPKINFSRISSETNYDAFKNALNKNKKLAICSTSFGSGQIMGFHYKLFKYNDIEDFYGDFKSKEEQEKFVLKYLQARVPITCLQNKDWKCIAEKYNGANYKENNYDVALAKLYSSYT